MNSISKIGNKMNYVMLWTALVKLEIKWIMINIINENLPLNLRWRIYGDEEMWRWKNELILP